MADSSDKHYGFQDALMREEEIFIEERKRIGGDQVVEGRDEELELVIPPVLENCTRVLGAEEQIEATDLYWEAVCEGDALFALFLV
ncbi:unnamed protein product, partial [Vitis vinifera]